MKSVLISIQPKWCELIASGKKTIEVRKSKPKLETPFKVYIYCTQGDKSQALLGGNPMRIVTCTNYKLAMPVGCYIANGKVIGEFVCNCIGTVGWTSNPSKIDWRKGVYNEETCLTNEETYEYTKGEKFYEWNISDLVIYDEPKSLGEFNHCGVNYHFDPPVTKPPQSWCYVEGSDTQCQE